MTADRFDGFPASGAGTVIPNVFFTRVLPQLSNADALLAFLWLSRLVQAKPGEIRAITADEIWHEDGAAAAFERLGSGQAGLSAGLQACLQARALLSVHSAGQGREVTHYFANTPQSRSAIARIRAGELQIRSESVVVDEPGRYAPAPVIRLYESRIGTVSPFVGKRLAETAAKYPLAWIEDAVNEAAPNSPRNWRNVELILESWERRGRAYEASGNHPR